MEFTFIELMLVIGITYLIFKVDKMESRIRSMKYTLDSIAEQAGIAENPVNEELRVLLKEGKDVRAVKVARENLGLSLVEGKKYVDDLKAERNQESL